MTGRSIAVLLLALGCSCWLSGCRDVQRQDTVVTSVENPSHTYRATVIIRQYFLEGKYDASPTTYVLLDLDTGAMPYSNGTGNPANFSDAQVVMQPSQCGPLSLSWDSDAALRVRCEKCGLALSGVGRHASALGAIQIGYDQFPEMSSWETAPQSR